MPIDCEYGAEANVEAKLRDADKTSVLTKTLLKVIQ